MENSSYTTNKDIWETGRDYENYFWTNWVKSEGSFWKDDFKDRLNPKLKLQDPIKRYLNVPFWKKPTILDVGAGPLTVLGKYRYFRKVKITAIDPLADEYNKILEDESIIPIIRTRFGEVEHLSNQFESESFDLVHMRNALDHSYDPLLGIKEMLKVVKLNHYVLLFHVINEAENENYEGFHQWNFCLKDDQFVIWNKAGSVSVNEELKNVAQINTRIIDNNWISVYMKKIFYI